MIDEAIARRVLAGSIFLAMVRPGALSKVDAARLNMAEPTLCVLGQLAQREDWGSNGPWMPGFHDMVPRLGLDFHESAAALGFYATGSMDNPLDRDPLGAEEYRKLTRAWRELILA